MANTTSSVHGWLDCHLLHTKSRKLKWPVCGSATTRRPLALCIIIYGIWSDTVVLTVIFLERQYSFCSHRSENWDTESQKTERTNAQGCVVCHVMAAMHTLGGNMSWSHMSSQAKKGGGEKRKIKKWEGLNKAGKWKGKMLEMGRRASQQTCTRIHCWWHWELFNQWAQQWPNNDNLYKDQVKDGELEEYSPCPFCWKSFCNKGLAPEQKYSS